METAVLPRRRFLQGGLALAGSSMLVGCGMLPVRPRDATAEDGETSRPARVGVLHLSAEPTPPVLIGLRQGLSDLGYAEGRDVMLEVRSGQGRPEAAVAAVRELVEARVRILVSAGTAATQAAGDAGGDLPIVFTQVGDPVAAGFIQSLARPGGNMTGFTHLLPATTGKRLELLRELAPSTSTILTMYDPANPSSASAAEVARVSAVTLGMVLQERHVKSREEVFAGLGELDQRTVDAILMLPDSLVVNAGDEIIAACARARIPVMFHEDTWVRRGGLASYGASFVDLGRHAAMYVYKILNGAKPADLPVEQPTRFDFIINLKTAQALGLTVSQSLLAQAAEVIQ